jgi:hypothetical protein
MLSVFILNVNYADCHVLLGFKIKIIFLSVVLQSVVYARCHNKQLYLESFCAISYVVCH